MRLSCDKNDPGYAAYMALGEKRHQVQVFVDGIRVQRCITADDEQRFACAHKVDDAGNIVLTPDRKGIEKIEIRGNVVIQTPQE